MKKPSLKLFKEVADACGGTIGKIATAFGVWRTTVYHWCEKDKDFQAVIEDYRGKLLDECLKSARVTALGIPKFDSQNRLVGWKERPDGQMLRYLISTLGKREGFGESVDITSKGESIRPDPIVVEVIDSRDKVDTKEGEE